MRPDPTQRFGCIVLLALAWLPGSALAAGPFITPPGVAERGLAGAAVAGPGSLASAWHNPATLVDAKTRVVGGWQATPARTEDDGDLEASGSTTLFGATYINRDKWYGTAAIGFATYSPYAYKLWVNQSNEGDSAFGRADVTTQIYGVPFAIEFEDTGLALGATWEIVTVDPAGSKVSVEQANGTVTDVKVPSGGTGYSGSFGARYRLRDEGGTRIDIGGVIRLKATSGASIEVEPGEAAYLIPDKPGGVELGVRWLRELSEDREFATYFEYGTTDWGAAGSIRRIAIAASYRSQFEKWGVFEAGERVLRLGYGQFSPDPAESWLNWPEGYVLTAGASFFFRTGTRVDLVLERRREERDGLDAQTAWFGGFAVGLVY